MTAGAGLSAREHRTIDLAAIPGDGIGTEVMGAALDVLDVLADGTSVRFATRTYDWSCEAYERTGAMMPIDGLEQLSRHDAILLGAVGWPGVPDHVSLWGLLVPIRRAFDQYVNLRPVRTLPGVPSPVRSAREIDIVIVRENSEGEYSQVGGRIHPGGPDEVVMQQATFSRRGVERIARFAVEQAAARRSTLTSATKSNGIVHTMPFWDSVVSEVVAERGGLTFDSQHIDALAAKLVLDPGRFDVIVASNLFGDILSDLAAAICGSIGIAPSANLNPEGRHPSMFEPVHGSAPDIAGTGLANPLGMLWSAAMMLHHLGEKELGDRLLHAVLASAAEPGTRTPDIGGTATTAEATRRVIEILSLGPHPDPGVGTTVPPSTASNGERP